jgi:hypothetical protein
MFAELDLDEPDQEGGRARDTLGNAGDAGAEQPSVAAAAPPLAAPTPAGAKDGRSEQHPGASGRMVIAVEVEGTQ